MHNIIEELSKKTKKEIIDILCALIDNAQLSEKALGNYLTARDYSSQEKTIIDKLENGKELTADEISYATLALQKQANIKIKTIITSKNKFDEYLVKKKIAQYFEMIWKQYPRKVGKVVGLNAFAKLLQEQKLSNLKAYCSYILQRVIIYAEYCQTNGIEEPYIMHFSTFCNSKKYL